MNPEHAYYLYGVQNDYWVPEEYFDVYLVACELVGFYRVPAAWIEKRVTRRCSKCNLTLTAFVSESSNCGANNCDGDLKEV